MSIFPEKNLAVFMVEVKQIYSAGGSNTLMLARISDG